MSSDRALRTCMQVLVLLNLAFVQMTESASLSALIPLYALCLGAPLLDRYRDKLVYLILWNGLVVATFAALLRFALRGELAHVLEYGLILAALCQVHLLNNLRSDQKPDLLFFNAFLIAIVAGYINRGSSFPFLFLAFAPAFVIGLQLLSATRNGHLPARITGRLVRDGAKRSVGLLTVSLLAFLFWPRDFERKAYFHGKLDMTPDDSAGLEVGFAKELKLRKTKTTAKADRPALSVDLLEGTSQDVPALWRGALLTETDGESWSASSSLETPWEVDLDLPLPEIVARLRVTRIDPRTKRIFAPLGAQDLKISSQGKHVLKPQPDGTVDTRVAGKVMYRVGLPKPNSVKLGGRYAQQLPEQLQDCIQLPESNHIRRARLLAKDLVNDLARDADQHQIVEHFSRYLARKYTYVSTDSGTSASTLDEFLAGEAGGHCEFFASALATMLRSVDVPCRIATGYRSNRWDKTQRKLSFGLGQAHAWVEVHDPQAGWYAQDPTPQASLVEAGPSLWERWSAATRAGWNSVTGFDSQARAAFMTWAGKLPQRAVQFMRQQPLALASLLAIIAGLAATIVHRRRAKPQPIRRYEAVLRRSKLKRLPGETPRELLTRARQTGLDPDLVASLQQATTDHELARYTTS